MKCPNDGTTLVMAERNGVEIDYCPECRGVWLDRGELDKIIERSAPPQDQKVQESRGYSDQSYQRRKKKDSFLSELFDF